MAETDGKETPLFTKCYDLLLWLTPRVANFPRAQRFLLGRELLDTAFGIYKLLVEARKRRLRRAMPYCARPTHNWRACAPSGGWQAICAAST